MLALILALAPAASLYAQPAPTTAPKPPGTKVASAAHLVIYHAEGRRSEREAIHSHPITQSVSPEPAPRGHHHFINLSSLQLGH